MIKSRYYNESELQRIVADTEAELDRRANQQRIDAMIAWVNDPANKHIVDNNPMVQKLRAMSNPVPAQTQPPAQRIAPVPASPSALPSGYKSRQQLEAERPWLRPAKPSTKIIDPYAR